MQPMIRASLAIAALASVAAGWAQTRPHNFDLLDVAWSVRLDEQTDSLVGDVTNTLKPNSDAKMVALDCGESLQVDSVTVDGAAATYRHTGHVLEVDLPGSFGRSVAIRIRYHGHPDAGAYFVPAKRAYPAHTPVVYTQGEMVDNRFWIPTYDYPDDKATSSGTIDVPAGWFALSNGKLLGEETRGGRTVYRWKMDQPHATYLISFVAGPYDKGHEEWDGTPVDYYVPKGLKDQGQAAFGGTADVVRFYSKITGFRYPYAKYSQSAVPDYMFGGMENITCTTQTIGALHPKSVEPLADTLGLVAHELAHQWFGDTVTANGWSDMWINEGWATFMPPFYVREKQGQEAFDLERYGIFQGGLMAHLSRPDRPVVYKGYKDALEMFDGFIYPGGASRMFMLMHQVGEERFWRACRAYLEERKYTSFDTAAFFATWSKNLDTDLTPFMNQWFFTNGAPDLSLSRKGDRLVVTQKAPYFDLDTEVGILKGGILVRRKVHLSGAQTEIELGEDAARPALIDPDCWIMANVHPEAGLTDADKVALFRAAPNAAEKARLMDNTLIGLDSVTMLKVAKELRGSSKRLLARFVPRLDAGATDLLLELTRDSDRNVANAAIDRLGYVPVRPDLTSRLRELSAHDPNDLIRQTATRVLLNKVGDEALAEATWKREGVYDGYRRIALSWWVGHQKDVARDRALEALQRGYPEPTRVEAIRVLGRVKDKAGERRAFEALAGVLKETSFGARNAAIGAMAEYGDKAAIPLLEPLQNAQLVFFRQSAAGAIERLRR